MTKMFSGALLLSTEKFLNQFGFSVYVPRARIAFTASIAAWQPVFPPPTATLHELYELELTTVEQSAGPQSLLNTPAFSSRLARIASAPQRVMRPYDPASHFTGRRGAAALSSDSMKLKISVRFEREYCLSSVVVTSGTPPNMSCSM